MELESSELYLPIIIQRLNLLDINGHLAIY